MHGREDSFCLRLLILPVAVEDGIEKEVLGLYATNSMLKKKLTRSSKEEDRNGNDLERVNKVQDRKRLNPSPALAL